MRFDRIVYMEWAKRESAAHYNLARSGARKLQTKELPFTREDIELTNVSPYGFEPLREAIARYAGVKKEQVATAQGTSMANFLVCAALLERGDEVIVEKPAYEPLVRVPACFEVVIKRLPRRYENDYQPDVGELRKLLSPKTRLVILSDLHNPSGAKLHQEILAQIGREAAKVGAWVLVDEIYLECLYDERPSSALLLGENFMVTSSLTKAYGLDGLRCGWLLGAEEIVKRAYYIYDFLGVIGSSPAESLSVLAFEHLGELQKRYKPTVNRNLSLVSDLIDEHHALEWSRPPGGLIGFVRLKGLSVERLAEHLMKRYRTSIVPGRFFEEPEFFRIGFGGESEMVEQGLQNLRQALEELLP